MRLALRWGAEFEQVIDGTWRPKDQRSAQWAQVALGAVAEILGYPSRDSYNHACRQDPETVQTQLDALDPNNYPEVLAG